MLFQRTRPWLPVTLPFCTVLAFMPLGCTTSEEYTVVPPRHPTNQASPMPESTRARLEECIEQGASNLSLRSYDFSVDMEVTEQVQVQDVRVKQSNVDDRDVETCMRLALRAMTIPASVLEMRSTTPVSRNLVTPQSRRQTGVAFVLGGIAWAPIIITDAGVTIIVGITMQIIHDALTGATAGTAGTIDDDAEKERCKQVLELCITKCTDETIPSGSLNGDSFFKCRRQCLEAENCWGKAY